MRPKHAGDRSIGAKQVQKAQRRARLLFKEIEQIGRAHV